MSHTLTVESALPETRMLFRSSMPDVRDWCPIRVCLHAPVSTSTPGCSCPEIHSPHEPHQTVQHVKQKLCSALILSHKRSACWVSAVEECHWGTFLLEHLSFHLCSILTCQHGQVQPAYRPQYPEPQSHCTSAVTNQTFHCYKWINSAKQRCFWHKDYSLLG